MMYIWFAVKENRASVRDVTGGQMCPGLRQRNGSVSARSRRRYAAFNRKLEVRLRRRNCTVSIIYGVSYMIRRENKG